MICLITLISARVAARFRDDYGASLNGLIHFPRFLVIPFGDILRSFPVVQTFKVSTVGRQKHV